MKKSPYIPFYTSDFLAGTGGLTAATKGVYITLLCMMYEAESPLPQSWATLARRSGCTLAAFKKAVEALEDDGKLEVSEAGLWSPKCEKHIALRRGRSDSAKANAKNRWEKDEQKQGGSDATAVPAQCYSEPEPKKEREANASHKKGSRLPDDWFLPREWGEWAIGEGWPEATVRIEADKFKDYWHSVSGQKGVKRDWLATWRNWMRNSKSPKIVNGGSNERTSKTSDKLRAFIGGANRA